MNVDESGAPWPYEPIEPVQEPGVPTWECPDGTCECQSHQGAVVRIEHTIVFFDADSKRMAGARCRVSLNGELVNVDKPFADGEGKVPIKVRPKTRVLELEWAPAELPIRPELPFRTRYYLDLGESEERARHRRLNNVGIVRDTDQDGLLAFGEAFVLEPSDDLAFLDEQLTAFHDHGTAPGTRASGKTLVRSSLALQPTVSVGAKPRPPAPGCGVGVLPSGSAAPPKPAPAVLPHRKLVFLGVNKPQAQLEAAALEKSVPRFDVAGRMPAFTGITPAGAGEFHRVWGNKPTEAWIASITTLEPGQPERLLAALTSAPNERPISPTSNARKAEHYLRYEMREFARTLAAVEDELRKLGRDSKNGVAVDAVPMRRLVLSAHHRPRSGGYWIGWLYSYNYLYLHIDDVASLGKVFPLALAQVEDLLLGACNTGHHQNKPAPFGSWAIIPRLESIFPAVQTVWAYEATAPGGTSAADEFVAWEVASRKANAKAEIVEAARKRRFFEVNGKPVEGWRSIVWTRDGTTLVPQIPKR